MFYSIFDLQTQNYLHSGRNSKTREEVIKAGIDYLTSDWDEEDIKNLPEREYEEILNGFEFQIDEHKEELPED